VLIKWLYEMHGATIKILLPCLQQLLAGSSSKLNESRLQSLTSPIQDPLQFSLPIDTRVSHVTSFLQVFKSNFHINFSFLSLRGACHSDLIFIRSNLYCHFWKELWSYESACYAISIGSTSQHSLNHLVFTPCRLSENSP